MHRGWVKLWRKSIDSAVFTDPGLFHLWMGCLMLANHKDMWIKIDGLADPVRVLRGQFITGRFALHKSIYPRKRKNHVCAKTLWRWLQTLKNMQNLSIQTSSRFSIVTICNYEIYNDSENENVQVDVQPVSSRCPAGVQPVSTNKNEKNLKNDKKQTNGRGVYPEAFEQFWKEIPPHKSKSKREAATAHQNAIRRLAAHDNPQGFLLKRIHDYYLSDVGKTQYAKGPAPWLNQSCWDDDPASWVRRDDQSKPQPEIKYRKC